MKRTFKYGGGTLTVDTDAMNVDERCRLSARLLESATKADRAETLVLLHDSGNLDAYLRANGTSFEAEAEKCGLFDKQVSERRRPPTVSKRELEIAESLNNRDLQLFLESKGML